MKSARSESVRQKDEVVAHFDSELAKLKGEAPELATIETKVQEAREEVQAFYADFAGFAENLGKDVAKLPEILTLRLAGQKGNEVVALQAYMEKAEAEDIVPAQNMMEAVASEDPDLIMATAMHKVANYAPSDKWVEEHPLSAMALEVGKPLVMQKMAEIMGGLTGGSPGRRALGPGKKPVSSPYGK